MCNAAEPLSQGMGGLASTPPCVSRATKPWRTIASHAADVAALREWLDGAGARAREERRESLGPTENLDKIVQGIVTGGRMFQPPGSALALMPGL